MDRTQGASSAAAQSIPLPIDPGLYLEDAAARRVTGDVLAGVEHAQRHTVEQDHQHAHPLKPPAPHPVKEETDPEEHPQVATIESERLV